MKNLSEKNLAKAILSDNKLEKNAALEIEKLIDEEMAKPVKERDYSKVKELTAAYSEITGAAEELSKTGAEDIIAATQRMTIEKRPKHTKKFKATISALSAAVMMIVANCITVAAFDMNIISAIIHFTKGGFSVEYKEPDVVELPTSEDDPYGIIAECAKYDIYPETPHYLPDGFVLESVDNDVSNYSNFIEFVFRNNKQTIAITYTLYHHEVGQTGIPSDEYNLSEIKVNGHSAIVSKEDKQYTVTYENNKLVVVMFTQDVEYSECDKIVASIY